MSHPRVKSLEVRRSQAGIPGKLFDKPLKGLPFMICASVQEMEFPHVPGENVVYPGPILAPVRPLSREHHPQMAEFLDRKRTIIINMGSNFWYTPSDVKNIADAIIQTRKGFAGNMTFQVLWKLNGKKMYEDILRETLSDALEDVHTEDWFEPAMLAILQHPNVVAFVNHGGASE
jgi:hypothetical protein